MAGRHNARDRRRGMCEGAAARITAPLLLRRAAPSLAAQLAHPALAHGCAGLPLDDRSEEQQAEAGREMARTVSFGLAEMAKFIAILPACRGRARSPEGRGATSRSRSRSRSRSPNDSHGGRCVAGGRRAVGDEPARGADANADESCQRSEASGGTQQGTRADEVSVRPVRGQERAGQQVQESAHEAPGKAARPGVPSTDAVA